MDNTIAVKGRERWLNDRLVAGSNLNGYVEDLAMNITEHYAQTEPSRTEVDAMHGPVLLEFGTAWCGHCRAAQPGIAKALADREGINHLKIEDGPGRPLGRSFRVKLWPTLILLENGQELGRVVRPQNAQAIDQALGEMGKD
ncbi:Thioredoxin [Stutzerimonas stutzeri RCH2]|uniref:Thioredoxin n=2 Tax=Stutzerimonas stutzeri TaxID=316 RepID=L0GJ73_STUST|nr:Thioredoxin [Stutzerimonas stutzeri RCH2]